MTDKKLVRWAVLVPQTVIAARTPHIDGELTKVEYDLRRRLLRVRGKLIKVRMVIA